MKFRRMSRRLSTTKDGRRISGYEVVAFDIPGAWGMLVSIVRSRGVFQKVPGNYDSEAKTIYNLCLTVEHPETRPLGEPKAGVNDADVMKYFTDYFYMPGLGSDLAHSYGDRLQTPFNQFDRAAELLKVEPWSRRAVMLIARVEDMGTEYPPCVREVNFFRPPPDYGALFTTVFMRSWDVYGASNPDMGSFQLAGEYVAKELGIPTGPLTVFATNAHIYRKQLEYLETAGKSDKPKTFGQMLAARRMSRRLFYER